MPMKRNWKTDGTHLVGTIFVILFRENMLVSFVNTWTSFFFFLVQFRRSRLQRAEELQQRDDDMVEASKGLDIHMRVKHDIHGIYCIP